ncbi:uncharacterized protein K460DRAFT_404280 [Cucurbitaria berberidis CBS 394.84]|uniref:Uncharacterized protein n=1 Tax=Cucurbitaria berberidis CBS 394.84 TaxID=1168544 RepID=A0A9P4GNW4_9PLEO|nr:uncharacterized protein K460DRAFT_404280 [Cucurbitaria berberidis CBS 394.84]KAF1849030.1 hypothetical protein K460DRAFT_404280 [Cucurbitaria berberidis CBS 394.84]
MTPLAYRAFKHRAGFLDLAGEIRNQIYELVMLNAERAIDMVTLVHYPREVFSPQTLGYRGLTQTCRQVRREFLPLYNKRNVYVEIDIRDITRFVNTFYHPKDLERLKKTSGSIEISLDREMTNPRVDLSDELDLLPLLRLLIKVPHLHARLVATTYIHEDGVPRFIHDLGTLFRLVKTDKKMLYHILHSMQRLVLKPLPSREPEAPRPELEMWLAAVPTGRDIALQKMIARDTGFSDLKALAISFPYFYTTTR